MSVNQLSEQLNCVATLKAGIGRFCIKNPIGACGGDEKELPPCQTGINYLKGEISQLPPGKRTEIVSNVIEQPFISTLIVRELPIASSPRELMTLRNGVCPNN